MNTFVNSARLMVSSVNHWDDSFAAVRRSEVSAFLKTTSAVLLLGSGSSGTTLDNVVSTPRASSGVPVSAVRVATVR
jgi:hypothetical protein